MSIPEKEFLSKKKCLYEVICFPDGHISIERRAIAYLNRNLIYVIVPGSDQLKSVTYNWVHDSSDTETISSSLILAARRHYQCITYFWDRPDVSDNHIVEAKKSYLQNRINDLLKELDKVERRYEIERGQYKKGIANYMKQLEEIGEMNDKIVYVLEAGAYSDCHIVAVTMDKEKAEWMERRYGSVSDPISVTEYVLDENIPEERGELHPVYKVVVDNKGQIKSVKIDCYTDKTNYVTNGEFLRGPFYRGTEYELYFNGYCTARDEEHAKKIIKDFRSKKLSEELGL